MTTKTQLKLIFGIAAVFALVRCASKSSTSNNKDLMDAVGNFSNSSSSSNGSSASTSGSTSNNGTSTSGANSITDDFDSTSDQQTSSSSQPTDESDLESLMTGGNQAANTQSTSQASNNPSTNSQSDSSQPTSNQSIGSSSSSDQLTPPTDEQASSAAPTKVKSIRFISSADGGTVEIKTDQPAQYKIRTNQSTNQTIVEIPNSTLSSKLQRPFIMNDFNTPFGAINAYQNPGGNVARIVVQMKDNEQPVVSQVGNSILLTPAGSGQPVADSTSTGDGGSTSFSAGDKASYNVTKAQKSEQILGARTLDEFLMGNNKFFGRPISIETDNANVRDVIKFIADESGVNIVIAGDVTGKISLKLRQVPWDQALVIVMESKGLGYIRQGNVLRITKLSTLEAEAKQEKAIVDAQKDLTPVKVKVIPVSYANVKDLATQIKPFLTPNRGQVVSDPRTSSIIITDTANVLARVTKLIHELDIPPAQVMIEGKVVEAQENFTRSIGVNWGFNGVQSIISSSGGFQKSPISYQSTLSVSPVSTTQGSIGQASLKVGVLNFVGSLSALLDLAETDNLVRIISAPRIVTMNKQKAKIIQKGQVIYVTHIIDTQTQTQTSQPVSKDVELSLTVTPQITAEGSVILDVHLIRQFAGAVVDPTSGARPINTREADTKVLVPNGQTAVIGGIYQSDETTTIQGLPWLKDIPVLGWLFKGKTADQQKNELLLFLTPRILNPQGQAG